MSVAWDKIENADKEMVDAEISYLELPAWEYLKDKTKPQVLPSFEPVPNEHNLHSAAKVAAGAIILLMLGWWLFWLKASQ